jgi:superoxide dismutase, Fe-Mn family
MIVLPPLPYAYDALAPVLSARTLRAHHDRHHGRYVEVANARAAAHGLSGLGAEALVMRGEREGNEALFNNAAQAWNHAFFWNSMAPRPPAPGARLAETIRAAFGDLARLREVFVAAGVSHFGSGWVWLTAEGGTLDVFTTHDAGTALTRSLTPLLACDLWEHAYYLDHENDRRGFLEAWWDHLANWDFAERQYAASLGQGTAWTYPAAGHDAYVHPIHEPCALERALEEAGLLLDAAPDRASAAARRADALIERIADYHAARPDEIGRIRLSAELDRRLRAAASAAARRTPTGHWAPMLGGDVRPHDDLPPTAA